MSYDPDWQRYDSWLGDVPMMKPMLSDDPHTLILKLLGIDPKEHKQRVDALVRDNMARACICGKGDAPAIVHADDCPCVDMVSGQLEG